MSYYSTHTEQMKENRKAHYKNNMEHTLLKCKEYRENHVDKIQQKHTCVICNGKYTTNHKARHFKTQKHQRCINNIEHTY
jgi:hypothetical protein